MLELWGMVITPSLPSLSGSFWPGVVASDKGTIYGSNRIKLYSYKTELFEIELFICIKGIRY